MKSRILIVAAVFCAAGLVALIWWPGATPPALATPTASPPAPPVMATSATPNLHPMLKPKPGDSAALRALEVDADRNGLPDHIEQYIDKEFADSAVTRQGMRQLAHGWMQAVETVHDKESARQAGQQIANAIACLMNPTFMNKARTTPQDMHRRIMQTRAEALATEERTLAYFNFQNHANGLYFDDPGEKSCQFSPEAAAN